MELSREEAIRRFREHWHIVQRKLYDEPQDYMDQDDLNADALREQGLAEPGGIAADCWLCAYAIQYIPQFPEYCMYCPIHWETHPGRSADSSVPCLESDFGVVCDDFDRADYNNAQTLANWSRLILIMERNWPKSCVSII